MLNSLGSFTLSILKVSWEGQWVAAAPRHQAPLKVLTWSGVRVASWCPGCFPERGRHEEIQSVSAKLQLNQDCQIVYGTYTHL